MEPHWIEKLFPPSLTTADDLFKKDKGCESSKHEKKALKRIPLDIEQIRAIYKQAMIISDELDMPVKSTDGSCVQNNLNVQKILTKPGIYTVMVDKASSCGEQATSIWSDMESDIIGEQCSKYRMENNSLRKTLACQETELNELKTSFDVKSVQLEETTALLQEAGKANHRQYILRQHLQAELSSSNTQLFECNKFLKEARRKNHELQAQLDKLQKDQALEHVQRRLAEVRVDEMKMQMGQNELLVTERLQQEASQHTEEQERKLQAISCELHEEREKYRRAAAGLVVLQRHFVSQSDDRLGTDELDIDVL
ncbi:PREDICTED: uncharacterized protein LOC106805462 [Priapulus caudatus]|uniref:Uncharacterized protein LOC106805462 n=1 Tax=Priapulus caudatus TaxID=37621 RepID=A0ABM1DRG6_PRICU|nr:PREDICTED: uncharacterized protein LOC106805462 [Priapulus caudatus]